MILLGTKFSFSKIGNTIDEALRNSKTMQKITTTPSKPMPLLLHKRNDGIIGSENLDQQFSYYISNFSSQPNSKQKVAYQIMTESPPKHIKRYSSSFMSAGRHHKQINAPPPVGYYKPKFNIIERKSYYNIKLSQPKKHIPIIVKTPLQVEAHTPKTEGTIKGPLQFEKQLDRYFVIQKQHLYVCRRLSQF